MKVVFYIQVLCQFMNGFVAVDTNIRGKQKAVTRGYLYHSNVCNILQPLKLLRFIQATVRKTVCTKNRRSSGICANRMG